LVWSGVFLGKFKSTGLKTRRYNCALVTGGRFEISMAEGGTYDGVGSIVRG
jgi:hypothetical protein